MPHVVILTHRRTPLDCRRYFLRFCANAWRREGIRVSVVSDPGASVEADLAVLHVDLSVVPDEYLAFVRRAPATINAGVADITKRRISTNLVQRGDGWDGPVIVKTDLNCGGSSEDAIAARGPRLGRVVRALRGAMPWSLRSRIPTSAYRVFDTADHVPRMVWRNRDLIVERFLPERREGFYCIRTWVFLGDRETNSICWSEHPVVKPENVLGREAVRDVPDELRARRRELGFDFGKFDYGIVDGRAVLYDANRTPNVGYFPREEYLSRIQHLAAGIHAFL